jgi:hypothetical protein
MLNFATGLTSGGGSFSIILEAVPFGFSCRFR